MSTVSVDDIARDPFGLLRRVEAGESLIVLRDQRAVAEIRPLSSLANGPRPFGLAAGEFKVPEGFDQPLPEAVLKEFEGT